MTSGITIQGLGAVQRLLINLVPRTKAEIKTITESTGRAIEAEAKRRVVVDTGALKASIRFTTTKGGFGAEVSTNSPYMGYVEFGTGGNVSIPEGFEDLASQFKGKGIRQVNLPARPFLIPAYMLHRDRYYQAIKDALRRILK